jgi:hypothetical protein
MLQRASKLRALLGTDTRIKTKQAAKSQPYVFNNDLDILCTCYVSLRFLRGALKYTPGRAKAVIAQLRPAVKIFRDLIKDNSLTLGEAEYAEKGLTLIEPYDRFLRCEARRHLEVPMLCAVVLQVETIDVIVRVLQRPRRAAEPRPQHPAALRIQSGRRQDPRRRSS